MATSPVLLNVSTGASFASLPRRIAAYLLDVLIAFAVMVPVSITMRLFRATGVWTPALSGDPQSIWLTLGVGPKLLIILAYIILMGPLYFILFHASPWQATFGKRLLNIYVADDSGQRISLARSCGRWLAMWLLAWFGGSLASLITIAASRNKKALHDMLAGTLVLNGRQAAGESLEPWRVLVAFGVPIVWLIATYMITM
jgi:uncharacterized RDD family membrane protein YckC